jgi:hypothetical protein
MATPLSPRENVGGNPHPLPRKALLLLLKLLSAIIKILYPISTVLQQTSGLVPVAGCVSPKRIAGFLPIITVVLPMANAPVVTPVEAPAGHTNISPATAAGILSISTVASPGPVITPPSDIVSNILAAGIPAMFFCFN